MAVDWLLASLHHWAILLLAAVFAFEFALTSGEVDAPTALRLSRIDSWYGLMAAVALAAGLARVFLGAKGPAYYGFNALFWIKMALFALVAGLSALPTLRFVVWRREARLDPAFVAPRNEVRRVRTVLQIEIALFALIPVAAAGIARGYGE